MDVADACPQAGRRGGGIGAPAGIDAGAGPSSGACRPRAVQTNVGRLPILLRRTRSEPVRGIRWDGRISLYRMFGRCRFAAATAPDSAVDWVLIVAARPSRAQPRALWGTVSDPGGNIIGIVPQMRPRGCSGVGCFAPRITARLGSTTTRRFRQAHTNSPSNLLDAAAGSAPRVSSAQVRMHSGLCRRGGPVRGHTSILDAASPIVPTITGHGLPNVTTRSFRTLRAVVPLPVIRANVLYFPTSLVGFIGTKLGRALVTSAWDAQG
jgi:hypothetical protein